MFRIRRRPAPGAAARDQPQDRQNPRENQGHTQGQLAEFYAPAKSPPPEALPANVQNPAYSPPPPRPTTQYQAPRANVPAQPPGANSRNQVPPPNTQYQQPPRVNVHPQAPLVPIRNLPIQELPELPAVVPPTLGQPANAQAQPAGRFEGTRPGVPTRVVENRAENIPPTQPPRQETAAERRVETTQAPRVAQQERPAEPPIVLSVTEPGIETILRDRNEQYEGMRALETHVLTSFGNRNLPAAERNNWAHGRFETFSAEDFPLLLRRSRQATEGVESDRWWTSFSDEEDMEFKALFVTRSAPGKPPPVGPASGFLTKPPPVSSPPMGASPAASVAGDNPATANETQGNQPGRILPHETMAAPTGTRSPIGGRPPTIAEPNEQGQGRTALGGLILALKSRARGQIRNKDYEAAQETIRDIVENPAIAKAELTQWVLGRIACVQLNGQWKESLDVINQHVQDKNAFSGVDISEISGNPTWGGDRTLTALGDHARMMYYEAEAHFQLEQYEKARRSGIRALRGFESVIVDTGFYYQGGSRWLDRSIGLLIRTTEAMGKTMEAQFYRGELEGITVEQTYCTSHEREIIRKTVSQRNDFLKKWGLSMPVEFEYSESGLQIIGSDANFMRAFKEALMGGDSPITDQYQREYLWRLLTQGENMIYKKDTEFDNKTPLFYAILYGNIDCIRELAQLGADVNGRVIEPLGRPGCYPSQPLSIAARMGKKAVVQALLESGALINGDTTDDPLLQLDTDVKLNLLGTTPLHEAVLYGHKEVIETLIHAGAEMDVFARSPYLNEDSVTPLHVAISLGNLAIVQLLLNNGANIGRITYERGNNILHLATIGADVAMLRYLLNAGADVNWVNEAGETPLDYLHTVSSRLHDAQTVNANSRILEENSAFLIENIGVFATLNPSDTRFTNTAIQDCDYLY